MGDFGIKWGSFGGWVLCKKLLAIHREIGWFLGWRVFGRDLLVDLKIGQMVGFSVAIRSVLRWFLWGDFRMVVCVL